MRLLLCLVISFCFFNIHTSSALIKREKIHDYANVIQDKTNIPKISNNGKLITRFSENYDKIIVINIKKSTENTLNIQHEIDLTDLQNEINHDYFSSISFVGNDQYIIFWRTLKNIEENNEQIFKIDLKTNAVSRITIDDQNLIFSNYYIKNLNNEEILILCEKKIHIDNERYIYYVQQTECNLIKNKIDILRNEYKKEEKINKNSPKAIYLYTEINKLLSDEIDISDKLKIQKKLIKNTPYEIYRFNIMNNTFTKETDFINGYPNLLIDDSLQIKAATTTSPKNNNKKHIWIKNGELWNKIHKFIGNDIKILNLSDNQNILHFIKCKNNFKEVFSYDISSNKTTLLASHPKADIVDFIHFSEIEKFLKNIFPDLSQFKDTYFYITNVLRPLMHTNNPTFQPIVTLFNNLNLTSYTTSTFTKNKLKFLLQCNIFKEASYYYHFKINTPSNIYQLYDFLRNPKKLFSVKKLKLFPERQKIDEISSLKIPRTFKSRDGLDLHCYITLPKNAFKNDAIIPHPFIVDVHGGPHSRNELCWEDDIQIWADRGIGTIQINYRGSKGFGQQFKEACYGEISHKMVNDIEDVVLQLIKENVIDQNKLAIHGYSYGATIAYNMLTQKPHLFKAGITGAGDADYELLVKHDNRDYWKQIVFGREKISNQKIKEESQKNSPIHYVQNISVPLLIISPDKDDTVSYNQTMLLHKKLKEFKKDVAVYKVSSEDHCNWKIENYKASSALKEIFICCLFELPCQCINDELNNAPNIKPILDPDDEWGNYNWPAYDTDEYDSDDQKHMPVWADLSDSDIDETNGFESEEYDPEDAY
ncbi:MAG: prolyl oligopeptidase family serine peptidase [Alphaproteobacteria bacterium]|nr:prolyl oligopeptidase family serine peptidase [Alphaproteobacteria bacterium]